MIDIVLVGAGGFAREVYYWARDAFSSDEYQIKGFLSDFPNDLDGHKNITNPILGKILEYNIQPNDRFLFAIGSIERKRYLIKELKKKGAQFLTLIHPTTVVIDSAKLGEGVILCPFSLISDNVQLGDFVMVNNHAAVGHDAKVGGYSILSPYSSVLGWCELGEEVFLGAHSTIAARKKVGSETQISANSLALRNVPSKAFVLGVPGKTLI
ncbi:MAG: acetyltransferase [Firmicutes bacterium]|nr:acetyltransferase [Bacillota bacterium]